MDDIAKYVINYYCHLMTTDEALAHRHIFGMGKIAYASSEKMKSRLWKDLCTDDPQILSLLHDGEEQFYKQVAERILNEYPDEVFLNYCPKCGMLARTPKAL